MLSLLWAFSYSQILTMNAMLLPTAQPARLACSLHASCRRTSAARRPARAPRSAVQEQEAPAKVHDAPGLIFQTNNRFQIKPEHCEAFEEVWRTRESHLNETPGFIRFAMLRGDNKGEYISSTTWASRSDFEAWTKSSQFQKAHSAPAQSSNGASDKPKVSIRDMMQGPPVVSLYTAVTVTENTLF